MGPGPRSGYDVNLCVVKRVACFETGILEAKNEGAPLDTCGRRERGREGVLGVQVHVYRLDGGDETWKRS